MLGGSHAYGLNTASSDLDYRGVFVNTDIATVVGLDRFDHQEKRSDGDDKFSFELRHFLSLLRKTNTQVLEILFSDAWTVRLPEWELLVKHRFDLLDSVRMYSSLRGYIHGEKRLATGERTGQLGGKRREQLERYGFSPKNFVQLIRLCFAGKVFFRAGFFPVDLRLHKPDLAAELLDIKEHPEKYTKDGLMKLVEHHETRLNLAFEERKTDYKFNEEIANRILPEVYRPIINAL